MENKDNAKKKMMQKINRRKKRIRFFWFFWFFWFFFLKDHLGLSIALYSPD
jgi:hypothetical protein